MTVVPSEKGFNKIIKTSEDPTHVWCNLTTQRGDNIDTISVWPRSIDFLDLLVCMWKCDCILIVYYRHGPCDVDLYLLAVFLKACQVLKSDQRASTAPYVVDGDTENGTFVTSVIAWFRFNLYHKIVPLIRGRFFLASTIHTPVVLHLSCSEVRFTRMENATEFDAAPQMHRYYEGWYIALCGAGVS